MPNRNGDNSWTHDSRGENGVSWEEPAVGNGTTNDIRIFLAMLHMTESSPFTPDMEYQATSTFSIAVRHAAFPISAYTHALSFFHMATASALPYAVLSGLNRGGTVGSMHSLDPPWDKRSMDMQIWGAGGNHNMLIVFDARHIYYHMRWCESDPGFWLSEAGACIPDTLPLHSCGYNVFTTDVTNANTALHSAMDDDIGIGFELQVGEVINDTIFKSGTSFVCRLFGTYQPHYSSVLAVMSGTQR